jgi:hypothetical protein
MKKSDLILDGAESAKTKDVKKQKRSHHVVENKGLALGSFSKRTHFGGDRTHSSGGKLPPWESPGEAGRSERPAAEALPSTR